MNHFTDIGRCVVRERNGGIRCEVHTLRLESQLRENGARRPGSRLVSLLRRKGYAFEEVDLGVDEALLGSLGEATGKTILLPLVFLGGRLVGGLDEIVALERSGDLERLVRGRV